MPLIPALLTFSPGTVIRSASENTNNATLRDTLNASALFIDVSRVITAPQTFDGGVTFNAAPTFAAGFTVTGGVVSFGSISVGNITAGIITATDVLTPRVHRPDNTGSLALAGGVADSVANGAYIFLSGNSSPYTGTQWIAAGGAAGRIVFRTNGEIERGAVEPSGTLTWQGAASFAGALTTGGLNTSAVIASGLITAQQGIMVTGRPAGGYALTPGAVQKDPALGLTLIGAPGSSYDFALLKPDGSGSVLLVPTGTLNAAFNGAINAASYIAAAGNLYAGGNGYFSNAIELSNTGVNDIIPKGQLRILNAAGSVALLTLVQTAPVTLTFNGALNVNNSTGGGSYITGQFQVRSLNDSLPTFVVYNAALSAQVFTVAGTGSVVASTGMTSPLLHARTAVGTAGYIAIVAGDASNVGYIEFHKPGPTRICYMGYGSGAALVMNLEGGVSFNVTGGQLVVGNSGINTSGSIVASGNIDASGTFSTLSNIALQNNDRYLYGTRPSSGQWRLIGIAASDQLRIGEETGNVCLKGVAHGFFNTAPIAKPTVTGSRSGIVALTSLMIALAALGLVTDSTT